MASASTGGLRLVRCPKCLNILPEPPNAAVYKCGGCDTVLRAKIRASNVQDVATNQVRQDSDGSSGATTASNGVPHRNKELGFSGASMVSSCTLDGPIVETEHGSNENGHAMSPEKNALEISDNENKEDCNLDGKNTGGRIEDPSDQMHPNADANADSADIESDEEENNGAEGSSGNPGDCRVSEGDDDTECRVNAPEQDVHSSPGKSKSDCDQMGASETEDEVTTRGSLTRAKSRSCDLRELHHASASSLEFHSTRTSLQSKSFRASEPLQSKIMKTVDELRGDLSEFFSKPEDGKPAAATAYPPRPSKRDGYSSKPRAAITSSAPLTAYHPAGKYSGHVARRSRSGQVPPPPLPTRGPPSLRCRRHGPCSVCHSGQMEMMRRTCPSYGCCHSCRPPCDHHRPWKQEDAMAMQRPTVQETTKRRPPPRHHCRPVLRGAPFVVCSSCHSLVQLPTEFAVPSKGTRRLQCGSCSELLSYSYRDPAKKKLHEYQDMYSTDDHEIHEVDDDHHHHHRTGFNDAGPSSYSEEYGLSYSATEDEQPLHVSRNSSFDTVDERNNAKLHRLMGYSSASELLMLRRSPDLYQRGSRLRGCRR
ncbi:hypothetical protein GUJ93_ZPchr0003g17589 [Zizania palustris]|uniref:Zinc-ribbon domain-containing protein n=1 Tax=Zizania palustris TaxID=103762 RepID=A0A8J5SCV2_ZIZPA|nr:hypothetical protein GUJ93_ZPchr0003g17589 [Zizania palustris]KAG8063479.1 hypothetical protein GUJ93_ZPchr0003g17589 [Zizania palustris]